MGSATVNGQRLPSCEQLYASGAAIRLPADSPTATYGSFAGNTFATRGGDFTVSGSDWSAWQGPGTDAVVFVARITGGQATNPRAVLVIAQGAVLGPLVGLQARVDISWVAPPAGVSNAKGLLRFANLGRATLANLRAPVQAGGTCLPSLATTAPVGTYQAFFGNGHFTLTWYPAMHAPGDSEIVLDPGSGPTWMTGAASIPTLLSAPWRPTTVSFGIHEIGRAHV